MTPWNFKDIPKDILEKEYTLNLKSSAKIAKEYHVSKAAILQKLHFFGIPVREGRLQPDLVGKKFGTLDVIELIKIGKHYLWKCKCDCGEIENNSYTVLVTKNRERCKVCQKKINTKKMVKGWYREISSRFWRSVIANAQSRGLEVKVTQEYVYSIFQKQKGLCALTGVPVTFGNLPGEKKIEQTASIDRIDNSIDYIDGNIQIIHKVVNRLRWDLGLENLKSWCFKIASRFQKFDLKFDFNDILILPKKSIVDSRKDVNLLVDFKFKHGEIKACVPIIAANMYHTGTFNIARKLIDYNILTCLHKHYTANQYVDFFKSIDEKDKDKIFFSVGARMEDIDKLKYVHSNVGLKNVCLDLANAYTPQTMKYIDIIKNIGNFVIMCGNVATPDILHDFKLAGVDIVKVGIGGGSVCETRIKTGFGYPQFSCALECSHEANLLGLHICSDGGCVYPADIVKAFAAGSSFVMIGGMLSGHTECEGDIEYKIENGEKSITGMKFFGMSSQEAMDKFNGGVANYRATEGKSVIIPYKGDVENTINDMLGSIRSACTYMGVKNLSDISKDAEFIRVSKTHNTSLSNS